MYAYGYDKNFVYTGMVKMQKNPRGEGFLLPANATMIHIDFDLYDGISAKFDIEKTQWSKTPDITYVQSKLSEVDELGVSKFCLDENGYVFEKDEALYLEERAKSKLNYELSESILRGGAIATLSKNILCLVIDHNYSSSFTAEQINNLQTTFTNIEKLLRDDRPFHAKPLIAAVEVDGVLVTQELKDKIGLLYENFAAQNS